MSSTNMNMLSTSTPNMNTPKQKSSKPPLANPSAKPQSSKTMSFFSPAKPAPPVSLAPQHLGKIFHAIPPVSAAAIPAARFQRPQRGGRDAIVVAAAARIVVAAVLIAVATVVQTADVRVALDSNAVPAVLAARVMIVVTAIPARRAVHSSSAKC